jgi:hypothetical protein
MNHVIVVPKHVEPTPSEDGQLTETRKGSKYIQIESHWMVLTIIILYNLVTFVLHHTNNKQAHSR